MNNIPHILIIDDEEGNLDVLKAFLSDFHVDTATSGMEGIEKFSSFKPDIILLDVMMPDMNGYMTCRKLREMEGSGNLKIIMVSAAAHINIRMMGYEAGADDYIVKPFDPDELKAKINVFTRMKSLEDRLLETNGELERMVKIRTEQLVESERLALIGRSTAGIVHNLNNPLSGILGYAEMILNEHSSEAKPKRLVELCHHMRDILRQIMLNSRKSEETETHCDIDITPILKQQISILRVGQVFNRKVNVKTDFGSTQTICGIGHHFAQAFGNIIRNAIEAMHESAVRELGIRTWDDGDYVTVEISDTGSGIKEQQLESIFDPFYTTKPASSNDGTPTGTGLGLASTKEIIESYGGTIRVKSTCGKGTHFTVRVPSKCRKPAAMV
ncbi:MAG: response regulator [Planctomycetes bacterium]|nr:response regulator [Planctomycetota bacterium]